jgi:hypothetical protein
LRAVNCARAGVLALALMCMAGVGDVSAARARPDLRVAQVSAELGNARLLIVVARIRNAGTATSGKSTASAMLSPDRRASADDVRVLSLKTPRLRRGKDVMITGRLTLSRTAPAGIRYVIVCADSGRKVRERSERNNCRTGSAVKIPVVLVAPVATPHSTPTPVPTAGVTPTPTPVATPTATATASAAPSPSPSPSPDPNDSDGDGVTNATDNCPGIANPAQADADADGKGDACDACPNAANPGNQGCPPVWLNGTGEPGEADFCKLQFPAAASVPEGGTLQVFGRIYEAGVTEAAGASLAVTAQVGVGPDGSDPRTSGAWTWTPMSYNPNVNVPANEDEYAGSLTVPSATGSPYDYAVRFSLDNGAGWTACDTDGAGSNVGAGTYEPAQAGQLTSTS